MANIKGGTRNDTLSGTASADRIQGLGGNDVLIGLGGNDQLEGGTGDDRLAGGAGSDTLDGGTGIDTIDYSGWAGSIRASDSGYATDTKGFGTVEEYDADGVLRSSDQYSYVENLIASPGNDYVVGGGGNNGIWGGGGDDWLHGGGGDDRIYGGDGDDLIDAGNGNDHLDGGAGIDTLFWAWSSPMRVIVDLAAGTISYPGYTGGDTLESIENVRGNYGTKEIFGSDVANIVQGSSGNDLIDGRGGDDVLVGDFGRRVTGTTAPLGYDDDIRGGDGNDLISGDLGSNILTGGSGADIFVFDLFGGDNRITDFEDGIDGIALYGGLTISGWQARDRDGDGIIDSQAAMLSDGSSILFEGHSAVPASLADMSGVTLHAGEFAIPELTAWSAPGGWGGAAATATTTSQAIETMEASMARAVTGKISFKGTRGNDVITVEPDRITTATGYKLYDSAVLAAGVIIKGDAGNDIITGGTGPDEIDGGSDNDTLTGGAGLDKLVGGAGNDTLVDLDVLLTDPDLTDSYNPNSDKGAIFDGGRGIDTLDFTGLAQSIAVNLTLNGSINPSVQYVVLGGYPNWVVDPDQAIAGRILNVENLTGGEGNDLLHGSFGDNVIHGGPGHDAIYGVDRSLMSGSNDQLYGDAGNDVLGGGSGNDTLSGGVDHDTFLFGESPDSIEGFDTIIDYEPTVDTLVFQFGETGPASWTPIDTNGDSVADSLLGTYDNGLSSITVSGITDAAQLTIEYSANNWPF